MNGETCHVVHNKGTYVSATGTYSSVVTGVDDLLAIDNKPTDNTALASFLCEGCHGGGQLMTNVGTGSDHPIDNTRGRSFYPTGVANPSSNGWSHVGSRYSVMHAIDTKLVPRCSSCHDAHGGYGGSSLLRGAYQEDSNITTTEAEAYCYACHTTHGSATQPSLIVTGRSPGLNGYTQTATGGTCSPTCHGQESYTVNYGR